MVLAVSFLRFFYIKSFTAFFIFLIAVLVLMFFAQMHGNVGKMRNTKNRLQKHVKVSSKFLLIFNRNLVSTQFSTECPNSIKL